jgi:hypothetical protein
MERLKHAANGVDGFGSTVILKMDTFRVQNFRLNLPSGVGSLIDLEY